MEKINKKCKKKIIFLKKIMKMENQITITVIYLSFSITKT